MTEIEQIQRDFKTSRRFGIFGVIGVMVLVAALALVFGSGSAHPTVLIAVILAIVFGFVAVLMVLQRRDLGRAEARTTRAAVEASGPVTDPTTADTNALIHALAVKPVDDAALAESQSRVWSIARGSMNSGVVMIILIACAVVPWQLFTAYWSLYIFVPIIVLYAVYLIARLLMPGGTLDSAYNAAVPTLDPLGLSQVERLEVGARPRITGPGLEKKVSGAIAYTGLRHGRQVSIRIPADGGGTTTLAGSYPKLVITAKGERLTARSGAPPGINALLDPLRASSYWKGVTVTAGADGIVVDRKRGGGEHWMRDLWLAEHLADVLNPA
ncbi:MAG: hypothetical protein ACJ75R_12135 [Solirubrobacterales bacterium]